MFECYLKEDILYINIPGCGLINPKYELVDHALWIKLNNKNTTYIIKRLPDEFIKKIVVGKAFLVEKLHLDSQTKHLITL